MDYRLTLARLSCVASPSLALSSRTDSHEEPKDLRSKGLCVVPVSCTVQVVSDNGADYRAPAFNGGFRQEIIIRAFFQFDWMSSTAHVESCKEEWHNIMSSQSDEKTLSLIAHDAIPH